MLLRRTPFARKVYHPPPSAPARRLERPVVYAVPADAVVSAPKHEYIRSKELLEAVRTLPCMATGVVGQTEPAHSNWQDGKGMAIKADDNRVAALARAVHRDIDQGSLLTEAQRKSIWWSAHVKTVRLLLARGQWPAKVPVPDIEHCPFDLLGA